ncbi:hypothetical protein CALCODRAFT_480702 [Calocera cornea HHB12733]|uniref:Uncharacterized protein n=1 Tax=Calocera cornea HHB12733 TaxID=1353952 RepID=A0A165ICX6_9BASI|nr:hypothetical protein CALCODRAFT_480702 [Calocera cornea HHB12733]
MPGISTRYSPGSSNIASFTLSAAPDSVHQALVDRKMERNVFPASRTMSPVSILLPRDPAIAQGKEKQIYALEETAEGAAGGVGWPAAMKTMLIASIREIEAQLGAPALINGMPLVGVIEQEGIALDDASPVKVYVAKPEDRTPVGENVEAVKPAADSVNHPACSPPSPSADAAKRGPTLQELMEYMVCPDDYASLTQAEFERALSTLELPGTLYGQLLREQELAAEEERKKAELRVQRHEVWVGRRDKWIEHGKRLKSEEAERKEAEELIAAQIREGVQQGDGKGNGQGTGKGAGTAVKPGQQQVVEQGNKPGGGASSASQPGDSATEQSATTADAKEKTSFGKTFKKIGGKVAMLTSKIGEGLMEHAIEGAIEGGAGF